MTSLEQRILKLKATLHDITKSHDEMVVEHNATVQEFQQAVTRNQNRFQQLRGAISELEEMQKEEKNSANK
jgi:hypothetical protein